MGYVVGSCAGLYSAYHANSWCVDRGTVPRNSELVLRERCIRCYILYMDCNGHGLERHFDHRLNTFDGRHRNCDDFGSGQQQLYHQHRIYVYCYTRTSSRNSGCDTACSVALRGCNIDDCNGYRFKYHFLFLVGYWNRVVWYKYNCYL